MVSTHTDSGHSQVEEKTAGSDTNLKLNSSHQEVSRTEADETGGFENANTPVQIRCVEE
jgi:hypothetical protein